MPGIQLETIFENDKDWVTLTAYEELKKDLTAANQDIRQLRKNRALLDSEVAEIVQIRQERQDWKEAMDEIALFLRENYKREIALGQHNGMSIQSVVIKYLGRERLPTVGGFLMGIVRRFKG